MVLYFSGTGNSKYAAKIISQTTNDELVSLNDRIKNKNYSPLHSEKPYVLVCPVYAGRIPRIVEEYILRTEFKGTKKIYFAVTCAQTPWITEKYISKLCSHKQLVSLGFNSIIMPQNYIVNGGTKSMAENKPIIAKAKGKIEKIAKCINEQKKLVIEIPGKAIMSTVLNPIMYKMMISAKGFYATDKCNGCGKCAERCPLNNISLENGKPVWGNNCTHCMACIGGCPTQAIEYGKKTIGRQRYYLE